MRRTDGGWEVTCVLPAYNEAECLENTILEWAATLESCTRSFEILVVDDGSTDGSAELLRQLGRRVRTLRVITFETNRGYGAAIANGFAAASFPFACFVDSDGQYDPADLPIMLERMTGADLVVGYRVRRADSGLRRFLSNGYNALARAVIGVAVRDLNCAFKLMPADTLQRLGVTASDFLINADLVLRARNAGLVVAEVPVRHRYRRGGRSKVRPMHIVGALLGLAKLRFGRPTVPLPQETSR
jgi:glycosyltransferase involved in cell wall biosynthesis